mgnify:FL=1
MSPSLCCTEEIAANHTPLAANHTPLAANHTISRCSEEPVCRKMSYEPPPLRLPGAEQQRGRGGGAGSAADLASNAMTQIRSVNYVEAQKRSPIYRAAVHEFRRYRPSTPHSQVNAITLQSAMALVSSPPSRSPPHTARQASPQGTTSLVRVPSSHAADSNWHRGTTSARSNSTGEPEKQHSSTGMANQSAPGAQSDEPITTFLPPKHNIAGLGFMLSGPRIAPVELPVHESVYTPPGVVDEALRHSYSVVSMRSQTPRFATKPLVDSAAHSLGPTFVPGLADVQLQRPNSAAAMLSRAPRFEKAHHQPIRNLMPVCRPGQWMGDVDRHRRETLSDLSQRATSRALVNWFQADSMMAELQRLGFDTDASSRLKRLVDTTVKPFQMTRDDHKLYVAMKQRISQREINALRAKLLLGGELEQDNGRAELRALGLETAEAQQRVIRVLRES